MSTRSTLACLASAAALCACDALPFREVALEARARPEQAQAASPDAAAATFRFSVAAVESPRGTYAAYTRLFARMGELLGTRVEFVQLRTYREVNDLLLTRRLDAALVCTGGYLDLKQRSRGAVRPVAVPLVDGKPTYRSAIIVPADSPVSALVDLEGKRFAFTDPLSFSGHAYAAYLARAHAPDGSFFGTTVFTRNHDRSIRAVAAGVVDGAAVHGGVLEHLLQADPLLRKRVRVAHLSPPFGAMPVVASPALSAEQRAQLREVLLHLHEDPEAAAALRELGISGFALPAPDLYDSAEQVVEAVR